MPYIRKTRDEWHLLANYGQGWEHELTEDTAKDARLRLREYRENAHGYAYRIVKRRVRTEAAPQQQPDGIIRISGPFSPPTGLCGPSARREPSHCFHIFDASGRKLVFGTYGPDREKCEAYARRLAAEKGIVRPTLNYLDAEGTAAHLRRLSHPKEA